MRYTCGVRAMTVSSRSFVLLALLGVVSLGSAPAAVQTADRLRLDQVKAAAARIRADDVLRDVSDLASDANMGRRTPFPGSPSPGYDAAAEYVARHLRTLGIKPMGDNGTYFQHYTVTRATLETTRVTGTIGGERLTFGDDFIINNFLQPGVREANVIYVGNGIRLLKQGVDPYAGFDIRGKWLLVNAPIGGQVRGVSVGNQQAGVMGIDFTTVNEVARHGGALGILIVPTEGTLANWNPRAVTGQDLNPSVGVAYAQFQVPRVILSVAALRRLLADTPLSADAVLNADATRTYPASVDLGTKKRVSVDFAATTVEARPYNVVGMLEGSDPVLKDEWISLAAHLDGAVPQAASVPGTICPTSTTPPTTMRAAARATWRLCGHWSRRRGPSVRSCSSGIRVKRWDSGARARLRTDRCRRSWCCT